MVLPPVLAPIYSLPQIYPSGKVKVGMMIPLPAPVLFLECLKPAAISDPAQVPALFPEPCSGYSTSPILECLKPAPTRATTFS